MPDLLERKRSRSVRNLDIEMPPSPLAPKEIFVSTHQMASREFMTANLSRAVIQIVRQSETSAFEHGIAEYGWLEHLFSDSKKPEYEASRADPSDFKRIRHQIVRRLLTIVGDALNQGKEDRIANLLEDWLSSLPKVLAEEPRGSFLDHAQRLAQRGQIDAALDIIYDQIDEMLLAGDFDRVDELLDQATTDMLSVDLLLGILTATLPAKRHLSNRPAFHSRVEHALRQRRELKDGLLVGLD